MCRMELIWRQKKSRQNKQVFVTIEDLAQDWLSEVERRIQNSHIQLMVTCHQLSLKILNKMCPILLDQYMVESKYNM